jgi:hypothetical protein
MRWRGLRFDKLKGAELELAARVQLWEFKNMERETETKVKGGENLQGDDLLEKLFARAAEVGIDRQNAWRILKSQDDVDPRLGILDLIEEVEARRSTSQ